MASSPRTHSEFGLLSQIAAMPMTRHSRRAMTMLGLPMTSSTRDNRHVQRFTAEAMVIFITLHSPDRSHSPIPIPPIPRIVSI